MRGFMFPMSPTLLGGWAVNNSMVGIRKFHFES